MIKAVIFDLDGTLLDTLDDLAISCNHGLEANGYPKHSKEEVKMFVGNGFAKLMERAIPGGKDNKDYQKVFSDALSHYAVHSKDHTKAYDGIEETVTALNAMGIKTGIVSNKPDAQVKELASLYFGNYMNASTAIGDRKGYKIKPAPDSVLSVMEILNASKDETIYVGDSDVDILTANNAGVKCISVTWGFRNRKFLTEHNASILIDRPEQILDIVKEQA